MITVYDLVDLVNHGAGGDGKGVIYVEDDSSTDEDPIIDLDLLKNDELQTVMDHPVHRIEIVKDPDNKLAILYHIDLHDECPHPGISEPIPIMEYLALIDPSTNIVIEDFFNTDEYLEHFLIHYAENKTGTFPIMRIRTSMKSVRVRIPDFNEEE